MLRTIFVVTLAVILGATTVALAGPSLLETRLLGFLTYLPPDYQAIAPAALKARLDAGDTPFLLDVREPEEFATGYIAGAVNIPIRAVPKGLHRLPQSKSAEIITICPSGFRSAQVTMTLTLLGYTNVKTMVLGMREWNAQRFPIVR